MIITIDGPSGTGKSTIAKALSKELGFIHFDTGAIYRCLAWWAREKRIDANDPSAVEPHLLEFDYRIEKGHFWIGDRDVTEAIRTPEISQLASKISAHKCVREALLGFQRRCADEHAVFDGRDTGTVVFPEADLKIYLIAAAEERAKRRCKELKEKFPGNAVSLSQVLKETLERDHQDSTRAIAPLKCPENAYVIDTTNLSRQQVVELILKRYRKVLKGRVSYKAAVMNPFYRFIMFFCYYYFKCLYRNRIYGLENYFKGGAIIAPNHVSYYDPPLVASSWPEEVHSLARETLFKRKAFAALIRALNAHPISGDVSDISTFKKIQKLLLDGKKIILFPEGSRGSAGDIQDIKPGIGMIMLRGHAAIIPVYLHGLEKIWPREKKWPHLSGKSACVFGRALHYKRFADLPKKEAIEKVTLELERSLKELKEWYLSGAIGTPP